MLSHKLGSCLSEADHHKLSKHQTQLLQGWRPGINFYKVGDPESDSYSSLRHNIRNFEIIINKKNLKFKIFVDLR